MMNFEELPQEQQQKVIEIMKAHRFNSIEETMAYIFLKALSNLYDAYQPPKGGA